jgi:hypothetical protein
LTADAVKKLQSYTAKKGHEADAFVTL